MKFVPSSLILMFSITYFGIWLLQRDRKHLLEFAISFLCFSAGILIQILELPANKAPNVLISSALYYAGAFLLADGVLVRSSRQYSRTIGGILIAGLLAALTYLTYVDTNYFLLASVVNFGIGAILLCGCLQAGFLLSGNAVERVFWVVSTLLAIQFFIRTLLTVGSLSSVADPSQLIDTPFWSVLSIVISLLSVSVGLALLVVITSDIILELRAERDTDPLTGLLNRRGLDRLMNTRRRITAKDHYCIIVVDIDNFKKVNDQYGHPTGDRVLIDFAKIMKSTSNAKAISRVGGEEFVILLSGNPETVWHTADSLRVRVENHRFLDIPEGFKITCSIGISAIHAGDDIWTAFARADKGLISAKQDGRNRVVTALVEIKS